MNQWKHCFKNDTVIKQEIQLGFYNKLRTNYGLTFDAMLQVAGPDIVRHIYDARRTVLCQPNSVLRIVDIDKNVIEEQKAELGSLYWPGKRGPLWQSEIRVFPDQPLFSAGDFFPLYHNIEFHNNDIRRVYPEKFIDADLMTTIKTCGNALKDTLKRQRQAFPPNDQDANDLKVFIFTISIRAGGGLVDNIKWVEKDLANCIGCEIRYADRNRQTWARGTTVSGTGSFATYCHKYDCERALPSGILIDSVLHFYNDDGGPMLTGIIIYH